MKAVSFAKGEDDQPNVGQQKSIKVAVTEGLSAVKA